MTSQTSCSSVASAAGRCVVPRLSPVATRSVKSVWNDCETNCRLATTTCDVVRRRSVVVHTAPPQQQQQQRHGSRVQSVTRPVHCRPAASVDFQMIRLSRSCTRSLSGASRRHRATTTAGPRGCVRYAVRRLPAPMFDHDTVQLTSSASSAASCCARHVLVYIVAQTYVDTRHRARLDDEFSSCGVVSIYLPFLHFFVEYRAKMHHRQSNAYVCRPNGYL